MDDDCAGRFVGSIEHKLTLKLCRQLFFSRTWDMPWLVAQVAALSEGRR
jgi:hypothetical protein